MTLSRYLYSCVLVSLICSTVDAQSRRPKVGLVLSGGGAKGIAHIGVLKSLEEAGITPDYITGTSMGSLVGALYACGYKADELREIVLSMDWDLLLTNKIPFNTIVYEEKAFANRYLLDFYYENKKVLFPKGIIEGEPLIQLFSELTRHVHGLSFDQLPIPFACIGTDIVNGKAVVLNKGSLAMAMRASMSIPSIFTPVRIGDQLFVDGGLVRNMPVSDVIDMGADIVIAVNVSMGLDPEEQLTTPISIITQSAFIAAAHEAEEEAKKADIVVRPDIKEFSTSSFDLAPMILERGDAAGKLYFDRFKRLADSLDRLGPRPQVVRPALLPTYKFDEIIVNGTNSDEQSQFITGRLRIGPNDEISISELEKRMANIYGTRYFAKLWFEILGTPEHRVLVINAVEHPQTQLRFSYHFDSENKGGVVLNATLRNRLLKRSRFIFEADLATFPRVTIDYLKYLGRKQNLAMQLNGFYNSNEMPLIDNQGKNLGTFASRYWVGTARIQTTRFLNGAFGAEAVWSHLKLKPKVVGDPFRDLSSVKYNHTTFSIYHRFDNTDDRYFATRGLRSEIKFSATTGASGDVTLGDSLEIDAKELGSAFFSEPIYSVSITINPVIPLSRKFSILSKVRICTSNLSDGTINFDSYDYIGGFIPNLINSNEYYGAQPKEFLAAEYLYGRVGLQYRMTPKVFFGAHYNFIYSLSDDDTYTFNGYDFRNAFAISAGLNSLIGPIKVYLAKDHNRKDWEGSIAVGFYF